MNDTERALLIILAGALAFFLLLAIIATIKLIQILNRIKKISDHAEQIADKAEATAEVIKKMAGPMAVGKVLASIGEMAFNKANARKSRREK
jgi:hypothetical protein